ncbi:MAG: hypothetical protein H6860_00740 [Rhodospirillales bacterium]|nr:hypothetical protein [Rhodospirillales bacterium]
MPPIKGIKEFDYLAQSFNRMTRRLREQQNELLQANRQLIAAGILPRRC